MTLLLSGFPRTECAVNSRASLALVEHWAFRVRAHRWPGGGARGRLAWVCIAGTVSPRVLRPLARNAAPGVLCHPLKPLRQQGVNDILAAYVQVYFKKKYASHFGWQCLVHSFERIRANFNRVSFYLKNIFWECISVYFWDWQFGWKSG